jgi:FHS family L-fucose permease-like MFS transporter
VGLGGAFALLAQPRLALGVAAIFFYVGAEVSIGSVMANFLEQPTTLALDVRTAGEWIAYYWGGAMVGRFIGAVLLKYFPPGKVLALAALVAGVLTTIAALATGASAGFSLLAVGLFNSIMFPTIFSLAVEGLGEKTPQGSALLCMAIVGGALLPLLTGVVADHSTLSLALFVPVACYAVIAGFGWYTRRD